MVSHECSNNTIIDMDYHMPACCLFRIRVKAETFFLVSYVIKNIGKTDIGRKGDQRIH